jgi:hypothetical protein
MMQQLSTTDSSAFTDTLDILLQGKDLIMGAFFETVTTSPWLTPTRCLRLATMP